MTADQILILVASGVFGATIGSFLNVVIHRLPQEGKSVLHPRRSICPACGYEIAWYDNIPVLSWLALRGKCRACGAPISIRYPIVELLTAALFLVLARVIVVGPGRADDVEAWLHLLAAAAFTAALIAAAFIDMAHTIIPDRITKWGMAFAPLVSLVAPELHQTQWLTGVSPRAAALLLSGLGVATGAGSIWAIGALGALLFRKKAREMGGVMGLGDLKFMGLVGGILGPVGVLTAIILACFAGVIYGVPRLLISKQHWMPFGPFLSLGSYVVLAFRAELFAFLDRIQTAYAEMIVGIIL